MESYNAEGDRRDRVGRQPGAEVVRVKCTGDTGGFISNALGVECIDYMDIYMYKKSKVAVITIMGTSNSTLEGRKTHQLTSNLFHAIWGNWGALHKAVATIAFSYLKENVLGKLSGWKYHFVGHSRGGSFAVALASLMNKKTSCDVRSVITFGCAPVPAQELGISPNWGKVWNIISNHDAVPGLTAIGGSIVGHQLRFSFGATPGSVSGYDPFDPHYLDPNYKNYCEWLHQSYRAKAPQEEQGEDCVVM
jgi:hypothetical protein